MGHLCSLVGRETIGRLTYPIVCSKWMSSTDAVMQEQPACLSAGRGDKRLCCLASEDETSLNQVQLHKAMTK